MEKDIKYANAFRVVHSKTEIQIVFQLTSPKISQEDGKIIGVEFEDVQDIRIAPSVAKELGNALEEQLKQK